MQELDGHASFVNSLCFDDEGTKLFTADGVGKIRVWNVYVTDQPSKRGRDHKKSYLIGSKLIPNILHLYGYCWLIYYRLCVIPNKQYGYFAFLIYVLYLLSNAFSTKGPFSLNDNIALFVLFGCI